jgi:general stress protein 26
MHTPQELEKKFWKLLKSDMVMMIGLEGAEDGHTRPMTAHGMLVEHTDREVVDRLWNPYLAAWYEGGMEDPRLALLRFDAEHAEIWLNENSMLAGVKLMLGMDPKKHYRDRVAEVNLRH